MPQSDTSSSTGAISSSDVSPLIPMSDVPGAIYIIRHGEKPPDDDPSALAAGSEQIFGVDVDGNQNPDSLIPQGWQRAGGLAQFFSPSDGVFATSLLARPSVIAVPTYGKPPEHRTYQTVWPLASKIGIQPTVTVDVGMEDHLATWLLTQSGQTVLVCWEHEHIEDITKALSTAISGGDVPGKWPADRFDVVVALTPDPAGSGTYVCHQIAQLLLAGDSIDPIPSANPADA